jgi:hypothetical protein
MSAGKTAALNTNKNSFYRTDDKHNLSIRQMNNFYICDNVNGRIYCFSYCITNII